MDRNVVKIFKNEFTCAIVIGKRMWPCDYADMVDYRKKLVTWKFRPVVFDNATEIWEQKNSEGGNK